MVHIIEGSVCTVSICLRIHSSSLSNLCTYIYLHTYLYKESSFYANFITAIFQKFPEIIGLCCFGANYFITAIFSQKNRINETSWPKNRRNEGIGQTNCIRKIAVVKQPAQKTH